jgi:hypothetical protein
MFGLVNVLQVRGRASHPDRNSFGARFGGLEFGLQWDFHI